MKNLKEYWLLYLATGICIFGFLKQCNIQRDFSSNGVLLNGIFISKKYTTGRTQVVNYRVKVPIDGKLIDAHTFRPTFIHGNDKLIGKCLPGKYSRKYNLVKLLILPEDFKEYGLPFPDSLRWVLELQ